MAETPAPQKPPAPGQSLGSKPKAAPKRVSDPSATPPATPVAPAPASEAMSAEAVFGLLVEEIQTRHPGIKTLEVSRRTVSNKDTYEVCMVLEPHYDIPVPAEPWGLARDQWQDDMFLFHNVGSAQAPTEIAYRATWREQVVDGTEMAIQARVIQIGGGIFGFCRTLEDITAYVREARPAPRHGAPAAPTPTQPASAAGGPPPALPAQ